MALVALSSRKPAGNNVSLCTNFHSKQIDRENQFWEYFASCDATDLKDQNMLGGRTFGLAPSSVVFGLQRSSGDEC